MEEGVVVVMIVW